MRGQVSTNYYVSEIFADQERQFLRTTFFLSEGGENFLHFSLHQIQKGNEGKYKLKVTEYI